MKPFSSISGFTVAGFIFGASTFGVNILFDILSFGRSAVSFVAIIFRPAFDPQSTHGDGLLVPVFIVPSPSLPRTAKVPPERSGPINKFVDVEAVASDADSSSDCLEESNADTNKYELDSVIVADDGSSIEWSASPPHIQADIERLPSLPRIRDSYVLLYMSTKDESADDMDVSSSPKSVFKDLALPVPKELYSNRVCQGTPEEKRPSSPKLYRSVIIFCPLLYPVTETKILSPIELSDDEYPVLPPKERLKPFLLRSPEMPSRQLHFTVSQFDGLVSISPSPPKNLTSIVVNGLVTFVFPARSVVTNPVSSRMDSPSSRPSLFLPDVVGIDHQVDEDSFDLCYPPESPKNTMSPIPAPSSSHGLSIKDYDNMDIDLPANFRSIPALRTPSPDLPSNPLEGWIPTPQSSSTLESRMRPVLPTTLSSKTRIFPSKLKRGMSPLKIPYGASPSPPRSLLSSPSHSNSDTSTVNTSPFKSSATGSPSSRLKGKDHLQFHPFSNSKRTTPSPLVTTPVKTPKPSAAGKKHRDAIIHRALTDALLSPSIPPIGFDNSASSSPPCKSRKELICNALSENDLMDSGDLAGFEEQYHGPQDVVPFIDNNLGENGVLNAEWIDPRFAASFRSMVDLPSRFDSDAWKDDPDNLSPLEPGHTPGKKRDISNVPNNIHCRNPLPFSRAVPIFDGRDSFVTAPAQLNQIGSRTYPLYKNSEEDPPTGCIVCVGYTAHTWQSSGSYKALPLSLLPSLQFIVVLALPPGYDGPDLPKSISSHPFPKPIYNTPTCTKDFPGPPRRKPPRSKPSSEDATGSSRISRHAKVDSDDDSPYLHAGGLKEGFEYHEDVMASKSNRNGR
ncbi:hypothetical protein C8R41DRAFT_925948 [Lentinula lateritia]|uniref:Uncharacterized protein n=1 Tax=Lentinula lateritia TaxID=40482 RepID=A0ABQ8V5L8_9AGAR|nr:hypothetical protein C8R41DRAFT_925948 [Lentinula lateritia]